MYVVLNTIDNSCFTNVLTSEMCNNNIHITLFDFQNIIILSIPTHIYIYTYIYICIAILNRHVILPKELAKTLPKNRLLSEAEWRGIGVQQSRGWQHYAIHR